MTKKKDGPRKNARRKPNDVDREPFTQERLLHLGEERQYEWIVCPECQGSGFVVKVKRKVMPCFTCKGGKVVKLYAD